MLYNLTNNEMNLLCDWCNGIMFVKELSSYRQLNIDEINDLQPHLWDKWGVNENEMVVKLMSIELFSERKPAVIPPNEN